MTTLYSWFFLFTSEQWWYACFHFNIFSMSMSQWFTKNLGDAMLASEALEYIKKLFESAFNVSNGSNKMAIFVRHESEGHLHCQVRVYFSPATAHVAEAVDAIACKKPASQDLGLLAGSEDVWSILFSGEDSHYQ